MRRRSPIYSGVHRCTRPFIVRLCSCSFSLACLRSFIHPSIHPSIHSSIHSFIGPFIGCAATEAATVAALTRTFSAEWIICLTRCGFAGFGSRQVTDALSDDPPTGSIRLGPVISNHLLHLQAWYLLCLHPGRSSFFRHPFGCHPSVGWVGSIQIISLNSGGHCAPDTGSIRTFSFLLLSFFFWSIEPRN